MKAVMVEAFGPVEEVKVLEVADPEPGAGEVLVALRAADINYPDILVMEGAYQVKPPLPFSPGKAGAGVVEAVGSGVTAFKAGDCVAVEVEYGTYAEKIAVPQQPCYPMPDGMGFQTATALSLVYQSTHYALVDRRSFQSGDNVLVLGATGGVGMAAVQLAKAMGAGKVLRVSGARRRRRLPMPLT